MGEQVTDFEKLKNVLREIGVPFELTDDAEESSLEEEFDTVIEIKDNDDANRALFMFKRDGSYKDLWIF